MDHSQRFAPIARTGGLGRVPQCHQNRGGWAACRNDREAHRAAEKHNQVAILSESDGLMMFAVARGSGGFGPTLRSQGGGPCAETPFHPDSCSLGLSSLTLTCMTEGTFRRIKGWG